MLLELFHLVDQLAQSVGAKHTEAIGYGLISEVIGMCHYVLIIKITYPSVRLLSLSVLQPLFAT
jgi:hypothetical protein